MNADLAHFEVLLGVSGGIAAYKAAILCSQLVQRGAGVAVVMTEHAGHFVGELTFSTLSGRRVYSSLWEAEQVYDARHIRLTEQADLIVVAPATANVIAKMATGICDDLLSTLLCGADSPILLAPAMNSRMWENPVTQRNVETLRKLGIHFIGPDSGYLACGTEGPGRMSEPEAILARMVELLKQKPPKKA
jgi:phosphopantothenoylcysteine decarboxylase/phosphopantothenate--cysteine ligase